MGNKEENTKYLLDYINKNIKDLNAYAKIDLENTKIQPEGACIKINVKYGGVQNAITRSWIRDNEPEFTATIFVHDNTLTGDIMDAKKITAILRRQVEDKIKELKKNG